MSTDERFVPKVHQLGRDAGPEDPLDFRAIPLPGDPELMLRCLVQEYAWMGWDAEKILALFHDPFHPALCELRAAYGDLALRLRVGELVRQTGVFHFRVRVREAPGPEEDGPELIELGILSRPEGGNHA